MRTEKIRTVHLLMTRMDVCAQQLSESNTLDKEQHWYMPISSLVTLTSVYTSALFINGTEL